MATQIAERRADPVTVFRQTLATPGMRQQLKMALPSHISEDKFMRVATTAVQTNPDLLNPTKVDQRSLFGALIRAAQDGLLPDGREGAVIPFKGKAQWMPMVAGIMKKVRNSGEIASWDAFPVFEKDKFQRLLGDDQRIFHEPYEEGDPGQVTGAYSIVTFKDGTKSKDYLPRWRIDKARMQNPIGANSLMWTKFYDEGAVKTVIRHHAKRLPQSTDIDAIFERDETMPHDVPATLAPEGDVVPMSRLDALEHHIDDVQEDPDDTQRGESTNLADALEELKKIDAAKDIDPMVNAILGLMSDEDGQTLRDAAAVRRAELGG
jgi:recombination protein RecT